MIKIRHCAVLKKVLYYFQVNTNVDRQQRMPSRYYFTLFAYVILI